MKGFLLLRLCCLLAWGAAAQAAPVPVLDSNGLELARRTILPAFALFLLGYFVLSAIKLVLNYLLKRQIIAAAVSESVVERLLPGPQDEQNRLVRAIILLLSSGFGLTLCNWYLPLGIHSVAILLFCTAGGFVAYYFFLRRQHK